MIDPFPGTLSRSTTLGTSYVLTDEQEAWLVKWYPIETNAILAQMMGVCCSTFIRMAKKHGLRKDMDAFRQRSRQIQLKIVESERRRDRWGLPRRTTYHIRAKKLTQKEITRRWKAKKWGYIIADARSEEGWRQRYIIYYDEHTRRNKKFEIYCIRAGFEIRKKDC